MLNNFHKMWNVVEEHAFSSELAALMDDPIRADEFVEGAKEVLCKKPESGTKVTTNVWFLPMQLKRVVIYYRFDDNNVYLLSIRVVEPRDEEN